MPEVHSGDVAKVVVSIGRSKSRFDGCDSDERAFAAQSPQTQIASLSSDARSNKIAGAVRPSAFACSASALHVQALHRKFKM